MGRVGALADLSGVSHVGGLRESEPRRTPDVDLHLVKLTVHLHDEFQQVPFIILSGEKETCSKISETGFFSHTKVVYILICIF